MESSGELRGVKKEIIEARGLIIKSNNLVGSLSAELRSIAKRQASYERHLTWNSIVAYIIFAVLLIIGYVVAVNERKASIESELVAERERAAAAEAKLGELQRERRADTKGRGEDHLGLYELIHDRQRQEAIDMYDTIDQERLSPLEAKLLADAIEGFRADLSMQRYAAGLELADDEKYAEAVEEFRASLRYTDDAGHATAAKIQLANSLRLQGKPREAIAVLQQLIEEHLDRNLSDDAYWFLALAHYDAHQRDEARSVLRALMRQFPDSQYYRAARIRAAEIQLKLYSSD